MDAFVYAQYAKHGSKCTTSAVYQYDSGRMLSISNIDQNASVQIQYSISGMRNSLISIPTYQDNAWVSKIPGVFLCQSKEIQAYVYITEEYSAQTTMQISIPVIERPKPGDVEFTEEDVVNINTILKQLSEAQAALDKLNQDTQETITELEDIAEKHPYINEQTNTWMYWDHNGGTYVDSGITSVGPTGPTGKQGKTGQTGPVGPKGEPGKDFCIIDFYPTFEELEASVLNPEHGDHYDVGPNADGYYRLYMFHSEKGWIDKGVMMGGGGTGDGTVISINDVEPDDEGNVALHLDNILPQDGEEETADGYIIMPIKAEDSDRLGGKPPEAYTAANLLYNSDWRIKENIINENGQTGYNGSVETINGWHLYSDNGTGSVTIEDGWLACNRGTSSGMSFGQRFEKGILDPAKTYTIAWCDHTNQIHVRTDRVSYGSAFDYVDFIVGEWVGVKWCALYEGSYTAETLPPYSFRNYATELLACKVAKADGKLDADMLGGKLPSHYATDKQVIQLSEHVDYRTARNLLYNSDFEIAQDGYNKYHDGTLYHAGMWSGNRHGSLSVSGKVKTFTSISGFASMGQTLWSDGRDNGKPYTLVVTWPDGSRQAKVGISPDGIPALQTTIADVEIEDGTAWVVLLKDPDGSFLVRVDANGDGRSISFIAIDLFEGSFTAESAPPHATRGYANELLACEVTEKGNVFAQLSEQITDYWKTVYPVGSIYMSVNSTSPASLFGGTWEQLKDCFLLGASDTYPLGSTGGAARHNLTISEMPIHNHAGIYYINADQFHAVTLNNGTYGYQLEFTGDSSNVDGSGRGNAELITGNAGGGESHNNMPPYLAVYMWKRVA